MTRQTRPDHRIRTDRLVLRAFRPDDGAGLLAMLGDPEVVRFEPYGQQTAADCDRMALERAADERFLAVTDADGELVGNLWVAPEGTPRLRTWLIGYVFRRDRWGRGLAGEAVEAVLTDLFVQRRAHRVVARCNPLNERSWRLLERVPMRREAHVRQGASFSDDEEGEPIWHDSFHYAILAEEWRALRLPEVRPVG
ncbi:RimJ/RimL family protein N-acetyltransferase [Salana multivorans]|uniref:RimJ/RimL family protein N-acetyltransferase n=1 Tax=Salana multivorans TaxID=120377 RepID=A0A3N2D756_9MICO|nr:GNAT family N-acetyltransferase [Salana multivorans]ROR95575.1 RimJ/RimL family protein N-acetyltransferase [Salana multivorans]